MKKNLSLVIRGKRRRLKAALLDSVFKLSDKLKLVESEAARLLLAIGEGDAAGDNAASLMAAAVELFYDERQLELRAIATLLKVHARARAVCEPLLCVRGRGFCLGVCLFCSCVFRFDILIVRRPQLRSSPDVAPATRSLVTQFTNEMLCEKPGLLENLLAALNVSLVLCLHLCC